MKQRITILILWSVVAAVAWAESPAEIIQKVQAKYDKMTSYSAEGETISSMKRQGAIYSQRLTNFFTIKLARPKYYKIEWNQPMPNNMINDGMAWSDGVGNLLMVTDEGTCRSMDNKESVLGAAAPRTSGASHTVPCVFFNTKANIFKAIKDYTAGKDEAIDGEDCYVISGLLSGEKTLFWIGKKDFLIRRKQLVMGDMPEPTDETAKAALKEKKQEATPEAVAEMKKNLKQTWYAMTRMKGTMTETHHNIVVDKPVRKEDYIYSLPKDIRLIE